MLKLIIQDDEGKTTVVPLIRDEITIGRKEGNTIRLTERNVSRRHARIVRSNGSVLIEDLDSYNGIRVNGTRIAGRVKVAESDRIQIGDYLLELKVDRGVLADPFDNQATQPIEKIDSAAVTAPVAVAPTTQPMSPSLLAVVTAPPTEPQPLVPATIPEDSKPKPRLTGSAPPLVPTMAEGTVPPVSAPPPQPSANEPPARLVVLSANFAGREFVLDKLAMVIGRTEDNDIVVNHRSISRHHAKIVKEHGRYSIVDLQSSNGVRVNGEEYGKVELRRGDLVDLGHVRIRFIEPGEDFIYDRDAPALRASAEIRRSKAPLVAILGVVVAAAAAAFFIIRSPSKSPESSAASPPEDTVKTVEPPTVVSTGPPTDEVATILEAAEASRAARKWQEVIQKADKALELDSSNARAKDLKAKAQAELADQKLKDAFDRAATRRDLKLMHDLLSKMNQATEARQEAFETWKKQAEANKHEILARAERLAARNQCDQVRRIRPEEWQAPIDVREKLENIARECQKRLALERPQEGGGKPAGGGVTPPQPPPTPVAGPSHYDSDIQAARQAYNSRNYRISLSKAESALDEKQNDVDALSIAGMSACQLRNADVANKYLRKLKNPQRINGVRQICYITKTPVQEQ